jgi:hypothetical protein
MSDETNGAEGWMLGDQAQGDLVRLGQAMRRLSSKAESSTNLIALGEAWQAIDQIIEGQSVDVDVGLSVGFRRGNDKFEEGLLMCCRVNNEELLFDELKTTWSSDVGSDHSSHTYAHLTRDGRWDSSGFNEWLDRLNEVISLDDARLETERDHL